MTAQRVGKCFDCVHVRQVHSAKGSTFFMCERAKVVPTLRKYPALPVVRCSEYERQHPNGQQD